MVRELIRIGENRCSHKCGLTALLWKLISLLKSTLLATVVNIMETECPFNWPSEKTSDDN